MDEDESISLFHTRIPSVSQTLPGEEKAPGWQEKYWDNEKIPLQRKTRRRKKGC
jgi:hypothetical protein